MSETVPEPKSVLCKAEPELDPDADPDSISAKDTETLDVTQDQNSVTTQEIVIDTEEAVMDDPDIEDVDYLVEEEEELEQDYEETKADDVPVRDSRLRRNPPRSRKAPKKFKRRSTLKENRLPIKSEFSEDDLETDFVTVSADVLPEDSGPHPFADLPASELLVKFRLLEYAHNQLKEKVKKQHRDLSHKLSNTSSKHSKSVFRVKALDAENRVIFFMI